MTLTAVARGCSRLRSTKRCTRALATVSENSSELYDYLRGNVYSGTLRYPCARLGDAADLSRYERTLSDSSRSRFVAGDRRAAAKEYMLGAFYRQAPIPAAIGLADTVGTSDFLHQEIDNMLDSGTCQEFHKEETGELVGMSLNAVWKPDPDLELFPHPYTATQWLNAAARVAQEAADSPAERAVVWRDLQNQLIHELGQRLARERGKDLILYPGCGYVEPRFRTGSTSEWLMSSAGYAAEKNALIFFLGTTRNFENNLLKRYRQFVTVVDVAPYEDLGLELDPGEGGNAFGHLNGTGGLVFVRANL